MTTLSLKNLPATVDRLTSLIRAGKAVRITDKGRTIATVTPLRPAARASRREEAAPSALSLVKHLAGSLTEPAEGRHRAAEDWLRDSTGILSGMTDAEADDARHEYLAARHLK